MLALRRLLRSGAAILMVTETAILVAVRAGHRRLPARTQTYLVNGDSVPVRLSCGETSISRHVNPWQILLNHVHISLTVLGLMIASILSVTLIPQAESQSYGKVESVSSH